MCVGCTTDTTNTITQRVVGVVEPQHKIYSATDSPTAVAVQEPSAVDLYSALPKQAEDCKGESSDIYPRFSEWVASSEQGQRNKATYTAIRWGACVCPFIRDNHKQPTSSSEGYECYNILLFLLVHITHFFKSILKTSFLRVTIISNLRGV